MWTPLGTGLVLLLLAQPGLETHRKGHAAWPKYRPCTAGADWRPDSSLHLDRRRSCLPQDPQAAHHYNVIERNERHY